MKSNQLIALAGIMAVILIGCASNNGNTPNQAIQKQNFDNDLGSGQFGNQEDSQQSLLERGEV